MKLHTIAAGAIGACATLFTSASFAVAYDSDAPMTGKAQRAHHAVLWNAGDCGSNTNCQGFFQGNNETTLLFNLTDPAFQADHSHTAGTTTNYNSTAGTGSPDIDVIDSYYPECPPASACAPQNDSASASVLGNYDIDIDVNGKLLNGFAAAETTTTAGLVSGYLEVIDGQTSRFCAFLTSAANVSAATSGYADFQGGAACSGHPAIGAAVAYETTAVSYVTCNPADGGCGANKSVPVPAFAAAALGLGLVGITLATRRRKTIS